MQVHLITAVAQLLYLIMGMQSPPPPLPASYTLLP